MWMTWHWTIGALDVHLFTLSFLFKSLIPTYDVSMKARSMGHIAIKLYIECFHSRGQHICKFIGTIKIVCIRKEFNSHRTGLGHQHGRRFIVLGHQYGRRDVMWKHSIKWQKRTLKTTTKHSSHKCCAAALLRFVIIVPIIWKTWRFYVFPKDPCPRLVSPPSTFQRTFI